MSNKGIKDISELSAFVGLRDVTLPFNEIRSLAPLRCCELLRYLNISHNQVSDLGGLVGCKGAADASSIARVKPVLGDAVEQQKESEEIVNDILTHFSSPASRPLQTLRCSNNYIRSLEPLLPFTSIVELWVQNNQLSDLWEVTETLRLLPNLTRLVLAPNPCCNVKLPAGEGSAAASNTSLTKEEMYRYQVINRVGNLDYLDGVQVSEHERIQARKYCSEGSQYCLQKAVKSAPVPKKSSPSLSTGSRSVSSKRSKTPSLQDQSRSTSKENSASSASTPPETSLTTSPSSSRPSSTSLSSSSSSVLKAQYRSPDVAVAIVRRTDGKREQVRGLHSNSSSNHDNSSTTIMGSTAPGTIKEESSRSRNPSKRSEAVSASVFSYLKQADSSTRSPSVSMEHTPPSILLDSVYDDDHDAGADDHVRVFAQEMEENDGTEHIYTHVDVKTSQNKTRGETRAHQKFATQGKKEQKSLLSTTAQTSASPSSTMSILQCVDNLSELSWLKEKQQQIERDVNARSIQGRSNKNGTAKSGKDGQSKDKTDKNNSIGKSQYIKSLSSSKLLESIVYDDSNRKSVAEYDGNGDEDSIIVDETEGNDAYDSIVKFNEEFRANPAYHVSDAHANDAYGASFKPSPSSPPSAAQGLAATVMAAVAAPSSSQSLKSTGKKLCNNADLGRKVGDAANRAQARSHLKSTGKRVNFVPAASGPSSGKSTFESLTLSYFEGTTAVVIKPDGSAHAKWPSGGLAVSVDSTGSSTKHHKFRLSAFYLSGSVMAFFDDEGFGSISFPNGITCLSIVRNVGGMMQDVRGKLSLTWTNEGKVKRAYENRRYTSDTVEIMESMDKNFGFKYNIATKELSVYFSSKHIRHKFVRGRNVAQSTYLEGSSARKSNGKIVVKKADAAFLFSPLSEEDKRGSYISKQSGPKMTHDEVISSIQSATTGLLDFAALRSKIDACHAKGAAAMAFNATQMIPSPLTKSTADLFARTAPAVSSGAAPVFNTYVDSAEDVEEEEDALEVLEERGREWISRPVKGKPHVAAAKVSVVRPSNGTVYSPLKTLSLSTLNTKVDFVREIFAKSNSPIAHVGASGKEAGPRVRETMKTEMVSKGLNGTDFSPAIATPPPTECGPMLDDDTVAEEEGIVRPYDMYDDERIDNTSFIFEPYVQAQLSGRVKEEIQPDDPGYPDNVH